MFGYVRPSMERLCEEDKARFSAMYCGLCRTLGQRYGTAARFILNYDFAFLALLLAGPEEEREHHRCIAHPVGGRDLYPENDALALAADCSVILAWWQLQDAITDSDRTEERTKYRSAARALKGAYEKARTLRPDVDRSAQEHLGDLARLEKEKCASLDRPADAFALLLRDMAGELDDKDQGRILGELLYHLGRWIYLVDAADDLAEDFADGKYNPLIYRFSLKEGRLSSEAKESLILSLDNSIRRMSAAFELRDLSVWSPIIRSVVYEGLFLVGQAVLEGTFQADVGRRPRPGRNKEKL